MAMLSSSGVTTFLTRLCHCTALEANSSPAPMSEPTRACVVETGSLATLASVTQAAVPASTASAKTCVGLPPTMPEENSLLMALPVKIDMSPPIRVAVAPHTMAVRYLVTPAPARVATPLDTSLAPLAAAKPTTSRKMRAIMGTSQGLCRLANTGSQKPDHTYAWQPATLPCGGT